MPNLGEGGEKPQFNILDEARRIARGESRVQADATRVAEEAQMPHLFTDLGNKTIEYTRVLNERNTTVSNQLGMGVALEIQQAGEVLDQALAAAASGENPEPDRKRALDEYFRYFVRGKITQEIVTMLNEYQIKDWPTSEEEDKKRPPAGNDLLPLLALAKMVYAMHERDELGLPTKYKDGSVGYPQLEKPRLRSQEERWQLAEQAVRGWLTFTNASDGLSEKEWLGKEAEEIVKRAREEFIDNKKVGQG